MIIAQEEGQTRRQLDRGTVIRKGVERKEFWGSNVNLGRIISRASFHVHFQPDPSFFHSQHPSSQQSYYQSAPAFAVGGIFDDSDCATTRDGIFTYKIGMKVYYTLQCTWKLNAFSSRCVQFLTSSVLQSMCRPHHSSGPQQSLTCSELCFQVLSLSSVTPHSPATCVYMTSKSCYLFLSPVDSKPP